MAVTFPTAFRARGAAGAFNSATTSSVGAISYKRTTECVAADLACVSRVRVSLARSLDIKEKQNCVPISRLSLSLSVGAYQGDATAYADVEAGLNVLKAPTATLDGIQYTGLASAFTDLIAGTSPQVDTSL